MRNAQWAAGLAACGLMSLAGCGGSIGSDQGDNPPVGAAPTYDATIVRDSDGVPHITGADYGDIGYGYGYVHAEDNLCVLAEDLITTLGRRAEFFGRDGSYSIPANGNTSNNVDSDFFWRHMQIEERVAALRADASPEAAAATAGFAAGYSRYVRELQAGEHPGRHAACRDAGWVTPITADDVYRRYFRLAIIASSSALVTEIGAAQPPLPGQTTPAVATDREQFPLQGGLPIGSNMYALSGEATQTGQSMLFGNPHFPWEGTERLYQAHMTIPGELDIMGASLYGVPAALIGFNRHVAWSHTVSTAYRFGLYELTLVPGNPTSYLFDGEAVEMESETYSIQVLETDGSLTEESRTLYRSHYGPMMSLSVSGIPVLGWDVLRAYTLRDANAENTRMINQFFAWNRAESLDDFIQKQKDILGVPWVNTAATGPGEPAYYADITVVPNVSDDKVTQCQSLLGPVVGALMPGLPVLRGSSSDCDWDSDADAPAPGIFGPGNLPSLLRDDWVHNCNDSYWLTHPDEPITGYAAIIGDEGSERSLRTRLCIRQVQDRLDGSDGRPGTGRATGHRAVQRLDDRATGPANRARLDLPAGDHPLLVANAGRCQWRLCGVSRLGWFAESRVGRRAHLARILEAGRRCAAAAVAQPLRYQRPGQHPQYAQSPEPTGCLGPGRRRRSTGAGGRGTGRPAGCTASLGRTRPGRPGAGLRRQRLRGRVHHCRSWRTGRWPVPGHLRQQLHPNRHLG